MSTDYQLTFKYVYTVGRERAPREIDVRNLLWFRTIVQCRFSGYLGKRFIWFSCGRAVNRKAQSVPPRGYYTVHTRHVAAELWRRDRKWARYRTRTTVFPETRDTLSSLPIWRIPATRRGSTLVFDVRATTCMKYTRYYRRRHTEIMSWRAGSPPRDYGLRRYRVHGVKVFASPHHAALSSIAYTTNRVSASTSLFWNDRGSTSRVRREIFHRRHVTLRIVGANFWER